MREAQSRPSELYAIEILNEILGVTEKSVQDLEDNSYQFLLCLDNVKLRLTLD